MILKSVVLNNIRSYIHEKIDFTDSITLLSGDIGSGKSSILLAIEFALFGIMKGDISGSSLLRHGEKEGGVTLAMSIDNQEIIINRTLKRGKTSIAQTSGYMIINGVKTELVPTELKARILDLLGYSQSLISKSKSLTYRYTVYTPQEDMKKIITSKPEERLDILRSVFGVDKYKRIKENLTIYTREIKRKISYNEGMVMDLDDLKEYVKSKKLVIEELTKNIVIFESEIKEIKIKLTLKTDYVQKLEKDILILKDQKNKEKIILIKTENTKKQLSDLIKRNEDHKNEVLKISDELKDEKRISKEKVNEKIEFLEVKISEIDSKFNEINKTNAENNFVINSSRKINEDIFKLTKCLTCKQLVADSHKQLIQEENNEKIGASNDIITKLTQVKSELNEKRVILNEKLKKFIEIKHKSNLIDMRFKILEEKKILIESTNFEIARTKLELEKLIIEHDMIKKDIRPSDDIEKDYIKNKDELRSIQTFEREKEINLGKTFANRKSINENIEENIIKIKQKEEQKKKINYLKKVHNYLGEFFENLVINMEKHVMATIYQEFNSLVKKWFDEILTDESISVRLDNEFTPIIEQNGYETEIQNLSGGEKTAVALSYRLALNKVINDVISTIKTKDMIILDEPTDGFSREQLEKVRDVIKELELSQVIIVSHEPMIESFANKVIRIEKTGHESKVTS